MPFCNTESQLNAFGQVCQSVGLLNGELEITADFDSFDACQLAKLASRIGDLLISHDILSRELNRPMTDWSAWMKPDQNPARRWRF